jgi:hypothetical protein
MLTAETFESYLETTAPPWWSQFGEMVGNEPSPEKSTQFLHRDDITSKFPAWQDVR